MYTDIDWGSMTYAGIWSYTLLGLDKTPGGEIDTALGWIENDYSVDYNPPGNWFQNPCSAGDAGNFALYYYYATMAKALVMANVDLINGNDCKKDLTKKLATLQNHDGSWVNTCTREWEGVPELCTAYALLALQAFQDPTGDFWMEVILGSPADLVVCDPSGRCCSKDECNIPGATFEIKPCDYNDQCQFVTLPQLDSGHYRFEIIGTDDGTVHLTVNGYRGDKPNAELINKIEETFEIEKYEVWEADVVVSSLVGPLTLDMVMVPEFAFCYPVANAGPDQTVDADEDCITPVTLVGSSSSDCDGDELTYAWTWDGGLANGMSPTIELEGLGDHTITLIVNDGEHDSEPASMTITVVDETPPKISASVSPDTLWPPNHKMVPVMATVSVSDNCDEHPDVVLVSVVSSEPDDAKGGGDGKTTNDIQDADIDNEDYNISLRAERQGKGDGRIYTIAYTATDVSGNSATATVTVPHNQ
jgi:hypothetical protein